MTDFAVRLFADDSAISHVAHLAACLWLVRERPEIVPERDLPQIIRAYNESVGGVNNDTQGYHETLTQFYIATVRAFNAENAALPLSDAVNRLLLSERGHRHWPLRFYSSERLFSVEARRQYVEPDLAPTAPE
jgi:hypothetical protein